MPYIKQEDRPHIDMDVADCRPRNVGELNYAITKLVHNFLSDGPRYADFNAAIGALECAKLELYRRHVAPYEDVKIKENGDV